MLRSSGPKLPNLKHPVWSKMSQFMSQISETDNVISPGAIRKNVYGNKGNAHEILGIRCEESEDRKGFGYIFVPDGQNMPKENPNDDPLSEQEYEAPKKTAVKRPSSKPITSNGNEASLLKKIKEYESDGDWFFCKSISKMMKDFPADVKNNLKFEILQLTMKRQIEQMNKE